MVSIFGDAAAEGVMETGISRLEDVGLDIAESQALTIIFIRMMAASNVIANRPSSCHGRGAEVDLDAACCGGDAISMGEGAAGPCDVNCAGRRIALGRT